jgi:hypothetical protein
MKKRLGNFSLLGGLICLVIFFSSSSSDLDYAYLLFGGICLSALGFLLKRDSRSNREKQGWFRGRSGENPDLDVKND